MLSLLQKTLASLSSMPDTITNDDEADVARMENLKSLASLLVDTSDEVAQGMVYADDNPAGTARILADGSVLPTLFEPCELTDFSWDFSFSDNRTVKYRLTVLTNDADPDNDVLLVDDHRFFVDLVARYRKDS